MLTIVLGGLPFAHSQIALTKNTYAHVDPEPPRRYSRKGELIQERWWPDVSIDVKLLSANRWPAAIVNVCNETGSGTGTRTLNLAVNRSLPPFQNWRAEFTECRGASPISVVCHWRSCNGN